MFCVIALLVAQCRHKDEDAKVEVQKFDRDSFLATNKTIRQADSMAKISSQQEAEADKLITSIKFDKEVYDFGSCTEGDKVKKTVLFTNTGKLPLVIKNAFGSCGCTIPTYDKEPVLPGKEGNIEVEFNSTNKPGANTKSVMIEANTNPSVTTITFSVKVKSKTSKGWFN